MIRVPKADKKVRPISRIHLMDLLYALLEDERAQVEAGDEEFTALERDVVQDIPAAMLGMLQVQAPFSPNAVNCNDISLL
jgi:hypothetical protein